MKAPDRGRLGAFAVNFGKQFLLFFSIYPQFHNKKIKSQILNEADSIILHLYRFLSL